MLIFNDMMIIAQDNSEKAGLFAGKRKSDRTMRVLQEVEGGIGKVAEVKDWSGWQGESKSGVPAGLIAKSQVILRCSQ